MRTQVFLAIGDSDGLILFVCEASANHPVIDPFRLGFNLQPWTNGRPNFHRKIWLRALSVVWVRASFSTWWSTPSRR